MSDSLRLHELWSPWNSPGHNTGVSSLSLLQWIFPTQGSNPGLPHCRWILYQLSHQGSPRILQWVASSPASSPAVSLLQQTFPTQELNQGLLHCRRILYQLSYQGSPPPPFFTIHVKKISYNRSKLLVKEGVGFNSKTTEYSEPRRPSESYPETLMKTVIRNLWHPPTETPQIDHSK